MTFSCHIFALFLQLWHLFLHKLFHFLVGWTICRLGRRYSLLQLYFLEFNLPATYYSTNLRCLRPNWFLRLYCWILWYSRWAKVDWWRFLNTLCRIVHRTPSLIKRAWFTASLLHFLTNFHLWMAAITQRSPSLKHQSRSFSIHTLLDNDLTRNHFFVTVFRLD